MIPLPPISTLFPYTTLFRSEAIQRLEYEDLLTRKANGRLKVSPISIKDVEEIFIVRSKLEAVAVEQASDNMTGEDEKRLSHLTDRKSTRLNSSHVAISYAVFCLKKKKE